MLHLVLCAGGVVLGYLAGVHRQKICDVKNKIVQVLKEELHR
jgi:hypothetical protein